jgi:serine transporter
MSYFAPTIAFVAIISSFFCHYMGATEGLKGIITQQLADSSKPENSNKINNFILGFMFDTIWAVAIMNPSILGMIEALGGPVIAAILYLMQCMRYTRCQHLKRIVDALAISS